MIQVYHTKRKSVWYSAAVHNEQIVATSFSVKEQDLNRLLPKLPQKAQYQVLKKPTQLLADALDALEEVFNGKDKKTYNFKTDMSQLSGYTRKVLNCTSRVPVGYVTSYGAIAKAAGGSARAVGRVEASNPFPLLIPCHRVVKSDLSIGGYGYGEQIKQEILRREGRDYKEPTSLEIEDRELALFPVELVKHKQGELLRSKRAHI
jgi:methylated-DNA-[protein]-cysteine S-methyltransferase